MPVIDSPALVQRLEAVEVGVEEVADLRRRVGDPVLGDLEHERLGPVDRRRDVVGHAVGVLGDLAGDADEPAQERVLLDDAGVRARGRRGRRARLERDEDGRAADGVEQLAPAQLVGDGDGVDRARPRAYSPVMASKTWPWAGL